MTSAEYTALYLTMHEGIKSTFAQDLNGDGSAEKLDFGGIIIVRNPLTSITPLDLKLNGPRTSQIYMSTTTDAEFADVYMASVLGDHWISDNNVLSYFKERYPEGKINLPLRNTYALPSTVSEVHPDIHYRQPGYNELGVDAVNNILAALVGGEDQTEVKVFKPNGYAVYSNGDTVTLKAGESQMIGALAEKTYLNAKGIEIVSQCDGLTVDCNTLVADATAAGKTGTLTVVFNGETLMTLNVVIE